MTVSEISTTLIDICGSTVKLISLDGWSSGPFKAVIQPLRYKNKLYIGREFGAAGSSNYSNFLYIGPVNHDLTKLDDISYRVVFDGRRLVIKKSEKVFAMDKPAYIWAILKDTSEVAE